MESNPRLTVLKRRSDFLHILKNGHRVRPSPWLVINFVASEGGRMRCGWTLPRQVGSAVIRNRLRRWSRAYFREKLKQRDFSQSVDVNLVFRRMEVGFYKRLDHGEFTKVLDRGWKELAKRAQRDASVSSGRLPNDRDSSSRG